jgi:hypothetical protein
MIPHRGGLPHSDTSGSTPARGSPKIFAACHVLHRLLAPRHPPDALLILKTPARSRALKASHRTHPTGVSRRSGAVVSRQSPAVGKRHETTTTTTPKQHRRMDQLHTHFRIFGQWPVVGRQTSEQRDTSPSDGLRPPSCPDRPKTQQNLIHNHQRTQRPTRDQSSDDSRQNTTITKPLTNQTLTNPNPPTTND